MTPPSQHHSTFWATGIVALAATLCASCTTPTSPSSDTGVGTDAHADVDAASLGHDAGGSTDAGGPIDVGTDAAMPVDAARPDSAVDAAVDAGHDAGFDTGPVSCGPHTFVVTTPGFSYTIDGVPGNPTLSLCRDVPYMFDLSAVSTSHPMELFSGATSLAVFPGGATTTYTVPLAPPLPNRYACQIHGFGGTVAVP